MAIDLVCAYRENGFVAGVTTLYDFVNSVKDDAASPGELELARGIKCFGNLTAPQQGQMRIRPVIVCRCTGVPDELAEEVIELVESVGGSDIGFRVSKWLEGYSDFSPDRAPLAVKVKRPNVPLFDEPYTDANDVERCPCCGEVDCGWLAEDAKQAMGQK